MQRIPEKVLISPRLQKGLFSILWQAGIFTLGCFYSDQLPLGKFMSMYGSVTDAQVFSRELSVEEMVDITSCRSFPNGDIISWDREPWALRSPWNRSEPELLDLENDICSNKENGYFMVPHKLSFDESIHVCKKLSGTPVTFTNKTIFDDIVHHLSLASNMRASGCAQTLEDGSRSVQVWGGGSDEAREGVWTTWDTNQKIEVGAGEFSILSVYAVLFLNSIYYGVKIDLTMIQKEHLIVW